MAVKSIGVILLVLAGSLVACIIGAKLFHVDLETADPAALPFGMWVIGIVATLALVVVATILIFNLTKIKPGAKNGFLLGLAAAAIGFVFDFLAFLPHPNGIQVLSKYFRLPQYWLAFILIIISCTIAGYLKNGKTKNN